MTSPNSPKPGSTPNDDSDLHTSGDNPSSAGSPRVDLGATSDWTPTGYLGEYRNPPVSGDGNPHSQGAAGWDGGAVDFGSLYEDVLGSRTTGGDAPQPTASDYWKDSGYGGDGEGHS